jgi:hypothetical protein
MGLDIRIFGYGNGWIYLYLNCVLMGALRWWGWSGHGGRACRDRLVVLMLAESIALTGHTIVQYQSSHAIQGSPVGIVLANRA